MRTDVSSHHLSPGEFSSLSNMCIKNKKLTKKKGKALFGRLQKKCKKTLFDNIFDKIKKNDVILNGYDNIVPGTFKLRGTDTLSETNVLFKDDRKGNIVRSFDALEVEANINLGTVGWIDYDVGSMRFDSLRDNEEIENAEVECEHYPLLPVMGVFNVPLGQRKNSLVCFDTIACYLFENGAFRELPYSNEEKVRWSGNDQDFFNATMCQGRFFVTNFCDRDPIRYYQKEEGKGRWHTFSPKVTEDSQLLQCRYFVEYKGFLLALSTIEGTAEAKKTFPSRIRFSQPKNYFAEKSWRIDIEGRGGFLEGPTDQEIQGYAVLKGMLFVFFDHSIWKLRFTGISSSPFLWQQVCNVGTKAPYSIVEMDNHIYFFGEHTIYKFNGIVAEAIDQKISDVVKTFRGDMPKKIYAIENAREKELFFTGVCQGQNFPDTTLCYNGNEGVWSTFEEGVTCFGSINAGDHQDILWNELRNIIWENAHFSWSTNILAKDIKKIIGGNQQGFVHVMWDKWGNDPSLCVRYQDDPDLFLCPNHNLKQDTFAKLTIFFPEDSQEKFVRVIPRNAQQVSFREFENGSWQSLTLKYSFHASVLAFLYIIDQWKAKTGDFSPYLAKGQKTCIEEIRLFCNQNAQSYTIDVTTPQKERSQPINVERENHFGKVCWKKVPVNRSGDWVGIEFKIKEEQIFDPKNIETPFEIEKILLKLRGDGEV